MIDRLQPQISENIMCKKHGQSSFFSKRERERERVRERESKRERERERDSEWGRENERKRERDRKSLVLWRDKWRDRIFTVK